MKKKKKKGPWLIYIEYLAVRCLVKFFSILPYNIASDAGGLIGRTGYLIDSRHRRIALKNLRTAFPEKNKDEISLIAKKAFENLGRSAAETMHIASNDTEYLHRILNALITMEGRGHLDKAAKQGKGNLILTAHFGNWELLGIALAASGYPLNVVARPMDNPLIEEILLSLRSKTGARVIPKKGGVREILRRLKKGEGVGMLIDQNTSRHEGMFVDFFGHPASTNRGPALIAMKSGAPVIPIFIIREGKSRHRIVFMEEVVLYRSRNIEKDILANTEKFTKIIESNIRKYPEQWFWMHQRWKTRPVSSEQ